MVETIVDYKWAKAIHVLAVVLWIGGVGFVTYVLIPAIRKMDSYENQYSLFEKVEHKFAGQARITTLLTGASGFYLIHVFDLWHRFSEIHFWWMHAMVFVWFLFTLMLFVLEPLFLHKFFMEQAQKYPERTMKRVQWLHHLLMGVSVLTVLGAMLGAH